MYWLYTYLEQIYEDVDSPGKDPPPLPPKQSKPTSAGKNNHLDRDGYLKIILNHTGSNATGAAAHESERLRQSAGSYTVSDYSKLSDSTK